MATIRKRGAKWQVQIRRVGFRSVSRSFHTHTDAKAWARHMEVQADRCEMPNDTHLKSGRQGLKFYVQITARRDGWCGLYAGNINDLARC